MTSPLPNVQIVSEPVYRQLARLCRGEIEAGKFKAGDRFWSERELAQAYGISRVTANKVISSMVAEQLLEHRPGIGTFVTGSRGLHASLKEMESFTGHATAAGFVPETRVLTLGECAADDLDAPVRAGLGDLPDDARVLRMVRLRLADGEPVILETRWMLAERVPGLSRTDLEGSLYALLEGRYGFQLAGETHGISARNATSEEAAQLGVAPGAALLVVEGTGFASEREPLWYQVLLHRGDRYQLRNEVGARGGRAATFVEYRHRVEKPVSKANSISIKP